MESFFSRYIFHNWQLKVLAIISAMVVWFFVNHSINDTKTIPNVPLRVINLPSDRTISGLLPNGILEKRITLTLTGTKDVIEELEPGDLEVLIDASTANGDEWIVLIAKKNLVSLNPAIDLLHHVSHVTYSEFVLKLSHLVTMKIPVSILKPVGEAPEGYDFLDVWPQKLQQTICGPEEELEKLKSKGLEITFDLSQISKSELDAIKASHPSGGNNEVTFLVPTKWKQVAIPYRHQILDELNDPEAVNLQIDFLHKEFLSVEKELPIRIYFPLKGIEVLNPESLSISLSDKVQNVKGLTIFKSAFYAYNVSRLFLDVIKSNLGLVVLAAPKDEREKLEWSHEIVDARELEDTYIAYMMTHTASKNTALPFSKKREAVLRQRFRDYLQKIAFYYSPGTKFTLDCVIEGNQILIR